MSIQKKIDTEFDRLKEYREKQLSRDLDPDKGEVAATRADALRRVGKKESLSAIAEQQTASQKLAAGIKAANELAATSADFTDKMRDRAIEKLKEEIVVYDKYIERLDKANKLIGETDLQKAHRIALEEALVTNDNKPLSLDQRREVGGKVDRNYYNEKGVQLAEKFKTTQDRIDEAVTLYNAAARHNPNFTPANRDRAIENFKERNLTIDQHISKLDQERQALNDNTLATRANTAAASAIRNLKEIYPGEGEVTPARLAREGESARRSVYESDARVLNEQHSSDLDKINIELERYSLLREKNAISEQTFKSAAMETYNQYDLVLGNIDSARAKIYQAIENSSAQLTDALVEGSVTGKLSFQSFADAIIRDMIRIVIQASITKPLMDALYGYISFGFGAVGTPVPATGGSPSYAAYAKDGGFVSPRGFADGGGINLPRLMLGGDAMGAVKGPGGPREDKILARLSNGEFVINAQATKNHRQLLEDINDNKFAYGGHVGSGGNSYQRSSGSGSKPNVNINVYNSAAGVETETEAETKCRGRCRCICYD